MRTTHPTNMGG